MAKSEKKPKSKKRDEDWRRFQFWLQMSKLGLQDFDQAAFRTNVHLACQAKVGTLCFVSFQQSTSRRRPKIGL
jgi:hypothetical protein